MFFKRVQHHSLPRTISVTSKRNHQIHFGRVKSTCVLPGVVLLLSVGACGENDIQANKIQQFDNKDNTREHQQQPTTSNFFQTLHVILASPDPQDRYSVILLTEYLHANAKWLEGLQARFEASQDYKEKLCIAYVLFKNNPNSTTAARYISAFPTQREQLTQIWKLATQDTFIISITAFWDALSEIAIEYDDSAIDVLLATVNAVEGAQAEVLGENIISVFIQEPVKLARRVDELKIDPASVHQFLKSSLDDSTRQALRQKLKSLGKEDKALPFIIMSTK